MRAAREDHMFQLTRLLADTLGYIGMRVSMYIGPPTADRVDILPAILMDKVNAFSLYNRKKLFPALVLRIRMPDNGGVSPG